jgi:acid phosphatase family membrane protein YuiD
MFEILSPYVVSIIVAWLSAHAIKYAIAMSQGNKQLDLTHQLFVSGGMPSSHAATSVAVWTIILLRDGVQSGLFGLATFVVLVVTYDAVKVRRSSGEQGEAIQQLIKEQKSKIALPRSAKGHTPLEVFAGALLGALIGLIIFLATK